MKETYKFFHGDGALQQLRNSKLKKVAISKKLKKKSTELL